MEKGGFPTYFCAVVQCRCTVPERARHTLDVMLCRARARVSPKNFVPHPGRLEQYALIGTLF